MFLRKGSISYANLGNLILLAFLLIFAQFLGFGRSTVAEFCKNGNFRGDCIPYNCTRDEECQSGSPGPYSRCRREFAECECFHKGRYSVAINNTCLPVKTQGDACTAHVQCKSIRGQSECLGMSSSRHGVGICGCPITNFYHKDRNECLPIRNSEGSACKLGIQCSHPRGLGKLAICDERTRSCRCWDTVGGGNAKTGWHEGKCHYSREANENCENREECIVGYHPNADCLPHESYRNETVCTCPENENCDASQQLERIMGNPFSNIESKLDFCIFSMLIPTLFNIVAL